MPTWRKSYFGMGAFALLPVAVLSSQAFTALLILLGLASLIANRLQCLWPRTGRALPLVFGAIIAWSVLTSWWAVAPMGAIKLSGSLAVLFLIILMLMSGARRATARERAVIGTMLVAGFVLGSVILAVELLAGLPLANLVRGPRAGRDILELSLLNPALTVLVLMAWPVGFVVWDRRRWAVIPAAIAVVVLVALGDGITPWIALGAGLAAFGLVAWTGRSGATGLGVAAAIAVLAAPVIPQVVTPERMESALENVRPSAIHRIYTWEFTAQRIAEKPLTGWGLDSSRGIPGGDVLVVENGPALPLHPHNAGLQIWLELGLPGALALAALLVMAGRGIGRLPSRTRAAATATFAAAFVFASLSFGIWQNWWIAALGLVAAVSLAVFGAPPSNPDPG